MAAPEDWTEAPAVRPSVYPSCVDVWRIPSGPETSHNALRGIGAEHGIARIGMELQRSWRATPGTVNVSQAQIAGTNLEQKNKRIDLFRGLELAVNLICD